MKGEDRKYIRRMNENKESINFLVKLFATNMTTIQQLLFIEMKRLIHFIFYVFVVPPKRHFIVKEAK